MPPSVRFRILLVDDEPVLREALARYLTRHGCDVATAADGVEGLGRLAHSTFDAIVSDIDMPEMDGLTFRSRVLAKEPALTHRFLLCSGSALHWKRMDPTIHFIQKPFEGSELWAVLAGLLGAPGEHPLKASVDCGE